MGTSSTTTGNYAGNHAYCAAAYQWAHGHKGCASDTSEIWALGDQKYCHIGEISTSASTDACFTPAMTTWFTSGKQLHRLQTYYDSHDPLFEALSRDGCQFKARRCTSHELCERVETARSAGVEVGTDMVQIGVFRIYAPGNNAELRFSHITHQNPLTLKLSTSGYPTGEAWVLTNGHTEEPLGWHQLALRFYHHYLHGSVRTAGTPFYKDMGDASVGNYIPLGRLGGGFGTPGRRLNNEVAAKCAHAAELASNPLFDECECTVASEADGDDKGAYPVTDAEKVGISHAPSYKIHITCACAMCCRRWTQQPQSSTLLSRQFLYPMNQLATWLLRYSIWLTVSHLGVLPVVSCLIALKNVQISVRKSTEQRARTV